MFASPRSELLALLAAIKVEPEENAPKLALADWLQEQPDEADRARGEFLYQFVQNNLLAKTDPARQDFRALSKLWNTYEGAWAGGLKGAGLRVWATNHMFRWGLLFPALDGTQQSLAAAAKVADTEEYAWVAGIAFRAVDETHSAEFARSPLLDSLVALRLAPMEGRNRLLRRLCASPRTAALQDLDIGDGAVSFDALATSAHLGALRRLAAPHSSPTAEELRALAASRRLPSLRSLDLSGCGLGPEHARSIASGTGLVSLTELALGPDGYARNTIGNDGLSDLIADPHAGRFRKLNLAFNDISNVGVAALCARAHMRNLTHLDLSGNNIPSRAAVELVTAEHLRTLEELNLSANGLNDAAAQALAQCPGLPNLRRLDLTNNRISSRTVKALRNRFGSAVLLN